MAVRRFYLSLVIYTLLDFLFFQIDTLARYYKIQYVDYKKYLANTPLICRYPKNNMSVGSDTDGPPVRVFLYHSAHVIRSPHPNSLHPARSSSHCKGSVVSKPGRKESVSFS